MTWLYVPCFVIQLTAMFSIAFTAMNIDRFTAVTSHTFQLAFKLVHNNSGLDNMTYQGMVWKKKKRSL